MKTIVFTAQPFGMGPISKAISIAENINNVKKVFFGTSVAYDFATVNPFDEVHCLSHNNQDEILEILQKADLFINVMDFPLGKLAKEAGCPYFLIDSLLYFWPSVPKNDIALADIYFCQNFFDDLEKKIKENNLSNARLIGTILCENFIHKEKIDQVIVNFGGCDGEVNGTILKVGVNNPYPFIILPALIPILECHFSSILITGLERALNLCKTFIPENTKIRYKMLCHKEMLEELYRSVALFTISGIQTYYDAADKIPIFCLPPQNHTHVKNLEVFIAKKAISSFHCLRWDDLYHDFYIRFQKCQNRQEKIDLVLEKIKRFGENNEDQKVFSKRIEDFLNERETWPNLVKNQRKALEGLGENGTKAILNEIKKALNLDII